MSTPTPSPSSPPPISDREVGGLSNLPLPPHHSTTPSSSLRRSDSDVSQTSTTSSVPRSSSFTRSKRFLTGENLSFREALGIIDDSHHGTPVETNSITLVENFDLARSAINQVFSFSSNPDLQHTPPPPPTNKMSAQIPATPPPPPPPPPPTPFLSRLVFGDDASTSSDNHPVSTQSSVHSSPSPQSPDSIASPVSTKTACTDFEAANSGTRIETTEKSKRRARRATSPVVRKHKIAKGEGSSTPGKGGSVEETQNVTPVPRSRTFARLFGIFSLPRTTVRLEDEGKDDDAMPTDKEGMEGGVENESRIEKLKQRSLPVLKEVSGPVPFECSIEKNGQGISGTRENWASGMFGDDEDEDGSSLSNIADLVVQERPLFGTESRSVSTIVTSEDQVETREASPDADVHMKEAPDSSAMKTSQRRMAAPFTSDSNETANSVHNADSVNTAALTTSSTTGPDTRGDMKKAILRKRMDLFKRLKAVQATAKHDGQGGGCGVVSQGPAGEGATRGPDGKEIGRRRSTSSNESASFTSAMDQLSTPNSGAAKGNKESSTVSADQSPHSSLPSPTVESMTTTATTASSAATQSKADRFCMHPGAEVYQLRGGGQVDFSGAFDSRYGVEQQFGRPVLQYDGGRSGINAHGFLDGPVSAAVEEEGVEAGKRRRDSHAGFLERGAGNKEEEKEIGIRKTKSGLRGRIVAGAKRLPRGRSFPRLRSWGEGLGGGEERGIGRTKSLSRGERKKKVLGEGQVASGEKLEVEEGDEEMEKKKVEARKKGCEDTLMSKGAEKASDGNVGNVKTAGATGGGFKEMIDDEGEKGKDGDVVKGRGEMVTIERVIRRTKADGSVDTVRKKMRICAERVLENGDAVVKRKVERMKEDGSGIEVVVVMAVIPKRKGKGEGKGEGKEEGKEEGDRASEETEKKSEKGEEVKGDRGGEVKGKGWGRVWSFQGWEGRRRWR